MLESLLPYYERELAHLRELSGEFARRYPKIAGRLQLEGDRCEDPHTERVIEAFAFLAARIHRKLDDEYPEIAASLLDVLYPHYLQPIPASTIVQFETDRARPELARRYTVGRHQPVHSPAVQGVECRFRTCYPVDLLPLSLTAARLELTVASEHLRRLAPGAAAVLTLELETHGDLEISQIGIQRLRFFLDGEPPLMHLLYEVLLSSVHRVRVGDGSGSASRTGELPASAIQAVGFGREEGMLEYDERSFLGYRLLTEYFSFPDKFLFVDFTRLDEAAASLSGRRLVIRCAIRHWPDTERHVRLLDKLGPQHLKLGCTPIVNLFVHAAEPIRVTHQQASYAVRADRRKPHAYEIVQIRRVRRVERSGGNECSEEVPAFYAGGHSAGRAARFHWHASREGSARKDDKGTDVALHLVDLDFGPVRPAAEVLSLELLCSNRDLPEQIPFGGSQSAPHTDFTLPGHPVVKRVRLLRKPTPSLRPSARRGLQWRLISHLSLNYLSIVGEGKETLQELLGLYDLTGSPVTNRQIQGIVAIGSEPGLARVAGRDFSGFVRGTDISLTLDDDYFVGASSYLFASVLERFFALYCAPNSFVRLGVRSAWQQREIAAWPPRSGEALVI
ncbi:type VI secretion system baseplate subunit TssF [Aromatoleum sp.]|uniref:type VI secretion system baseplate subunit TssF n=1 Tax=Aromatoleum sp. TaxID=2307007 RepID=UPI002FC5CC85